MAKTVAQNSQDLLDQIAKAKQALEALERLGRDNRGEFLDPATVRSLLNAAQAHVLRAVEKSRLLR
ncbi:MAG: hypothetical protein HQL91_06195 [Magnetococcales bacterium]|nr:hypothetical protein [Magnetococcales bacterium]